MPNHIKILPHFPADILSAMNLKNEMSRDLAFLRKESLDIYNRVHSVAEDIVFVNQIRDHYSDNYPVVRMYEIFLRL